MSRKGSQSTTQQTSNTSYADQSVNVAEGGLAAAAGSTVHVESLSDDVALGSLAAQGQLCIPLPPNCLSADISGRCARCNPKYTLLSNYQCIFIATPP
ncbi:MAG TPA: hypothetical protein PLG56_09480, partial [Lacunisphaera sp.]|nr:hypothetical protein [Lacunisphaera sp.]